MSVREELSDFARDVRKSSGEGSVTEEIWREFVRNQGKFWDACKEAYDADDSARVEKWLREFADPESSSVEWFAHFYKVQPPYAKDHFGSKNRGSVSTSELVKRMNRLLRGTRLAIAVKSLNQDEINQVITEGWPELGELDWARAGGPSGGTFDSTEPPQGAIENHARTILAAATPLCPVVL